MIYLLPDRVCVSNKIEDVNVNICNDNSIQWIKIIHETYFM